MQHHVFLSYSRRDLPMMQRVRDDLRSQGLRVWTDEGIHPGTISWKESIERAIRETGLLLVLLSPESNDSKWVQREIDYAEVRGIPILPALIRGEARDAIPFALAGAQFVDLRANYDSGLTLLLQRCFHQLPPAYLKTLPARRADTTVMSVKSRQNRRIKAWLALASALGVLMLFIGGFIAGQRIFAQVQGEIAASPMATSLPTAEVIGTVLLRYNANTLVLMNRDDEQVSLYGLSFDLAATNRQVNFEASEWTSQVINTGRCVQVWGTNFSYLPPDEHPAEVCQSRVAYRSTRHTFWRSNDGSAEFIISRYGQEIGRCPVIMPSSEETLTCMVNL